MNMSVLKWDPGFDYKYPVRVYKTSIVACAEPTELMMKNYGELIVDKSTREEIEEDEITEVNDMMTELLKVISTKTMH